jgi:hypothetical protein
MKCLLLLFKTTFPQVVSKFNDEQQTSNHKQIPKKILLGISLTNKIVEDKNKKLT